MAKDTSPYVWPVGLLSSQDCPLAIVTCHTTHDARTDRRTPPYHTPHTLHNKSKAIQYTKKQKRKKYSKKMKYTKYSHGAVVREMNDLASHILRNIPGHRESQQHNLRKLNDLVNHNDDYKRRIEEAQARLGRPLRQSERLAIIAKSTAKGPKTPKKRPSVVQKRPRKNATARLRAQRNRATNVLEDGASARRQLRFEAAMKRLDDDTIDKVLAALEKRAEG